MTETRPRILLVDDNLEMARTLADGLAERGYDGIAVGSGREAQERLASGGARDLFSAPASRRFASRRIAAGRWHGSRHRKRRAASIRSDDGHYASSRMV